MKKYKPDELETLIQNIKDDKARGRAMLLKWNCLGKECKI